MELFKWISFVKVQYNLKILFKPTNYCCAQYCLQRCHINRDKMLSILKGPKFEQILQKARENWVEFTPTKEVVVTAGIDSSFNNTKFQGIELWATTAVSIKSDGEDSS